LLALIHLGGDLAGNLVIGDASVPAAHQAAGSLEAQVEALLLDGTPLAPSSAGGEQAKMLVANSIVKFSPTPASPYHQRWCDLLVVEQHCLCTLNDYGIPAAMARAWRGADRTWLGVDRFDRLGNQGRLGAVTWTWLDADLYGTGDAARCAGHLHADGHLSDTDFAHFQRAHSFSAAIGNNDTHLGNYGLVFDDDGRPRLAPLYDVLPMAFAPTFDGLPTPQPAPIVNDPAVTLMVDDLAGRITGDMSISDEFKAQWLQHVGRSPR
jgi:hypothetical protein